MEKDDEHTQGKYDFGARIYDSRLGRWLAVDPLFEKFAAFAPYVFVAGMPISAIDPDGRDIIVLAHPNKADPAGRHWVGHQAVLIGSEADGWYYYSFDLDEGVEGRVGNDKFTTGVFFESVEDFANSEHNTFKDDYDDGKGTETSHKDSEGNIIQRYDRAFKITTDKETDEKMKVAANKTFDKPYSLVFPERNCSTVAKNALKAGGLKTGEWDYTLQPNLFPDTKQTWIEIKNKGEKIYDQLERDETEE